MTRCELCEAGHVPQQEEIWIHPYPAGHPRRLLSRGVRCSAKNTRRHGLQPGSHRWEWCDFRRPGDAATRRAMRCIACGDVKDNGAYWRDGQARPFAGECRGEELGPSDVGVLP